MGFLTSNSQTQLNNEATSFQNLINLLSATGQQAGITRNQSAQDYLQNSLMSNQENLQALISILSQQGMANKADSDAAKINMTGTLTNAGLSDLLSSRELQRDLISGKANDTSSVLQSALANLLGAEMTSAGNISDILNNWNFQIINTVGFQELYNDLYNAFYSNTATAGAGGSLRDVYDKFLDNLSKQSRTIKDTSSKNSSDKSGTSSALQRTLDRFTKDSNILKERKASNTKKTPTHGFPSSSKGSSDVPELLSRSGSGYTPTQDTVLGMTLDDILNQDVSNLYSNSSQDELYHLLMDPITGENYSYLEDLNKFLGLL